MPDESVSMSTSIAISEDRRLTPADVHLAEYNVLANRITYYVALQYGVWAVAAALFGYEAPLWLSLHPPHHRSLEWIGLVSILAVIWAVLHINYEFLLIALYIEKTLHKPIAASVGVGKELNAVLGFESFIRKRDGLEVFLRDIAPSIVFVAGTGVLSAILVIDIIHKHWSSLDWWWVSVSASLLLIVCFKFGRLCFLNRELERTVSGELKD